MQPCAKPEEIAAVAYRIYMEEGCPEGKAEEHWARAERSIREQRVPVHISPEEKTPKKTF